MNPAAPMMPPSLLGASIDHLQRFAPFSRMEQGHLAFLVQRLKLGYYAKGATILTPEQGVATHFYIIKQGEVQGTRAQDDNAWLELHEGECFPVGALLSGRGVTSTYRASVATFCYELAAADFLELIRLSPAFQDFCTRRIASLLEQSKQIIQAQYANSSSGQQSMNSPLSAIIRRAPVTCAPSTPVREVLQTMHDLGIGAMVATDDGVPLGIFTLHDVLNRVVLVRLNLDQPIIGIMSTGLTSLPPAAMAYEAALEMARHGIRHVLVTDGGKLVGVISEKDLFTLQRVGLRQVSSTIRNATGIDALKQVAGDIRQLAHNMLAQGVAAEQLTQFISTLNDLLTERIIELECAAGCPADFCWLALGSEGRFEQTLNTDQDNGIIFAVPPGMTAEQVRSRLLPVAKRINEALAVCGFPLCRGGVMASNPHWCLSLEEWQNQFADWIDHGAPEALLNATIFFDFRPLYGATELATKLATALHEWLLPKVAANPRFLHQLAANALQNHPPLGLMRDFAVSREHTLDLKLNGVTPFVDAVRIFALASGVGSTNTVQRLRLAAAKLNIPPAETEAWVEALNFIQLLRLRRQHEESHTGAVVENAMENAMGNTIDPDKLNDLDRRILKEAFRQARKLQSRLALDYKL